MFIAQIQFPFDSSDEEDEALRIASSILGSMWQNGQLSVRDFSVLSSPQGFSAFVTIPAEDALESRNHNKWVELGIDRFIAQGGQRPTFAVIGRDTESFDVCDCTESHGYVLYTRWLSCESPLRCAFCFDPIPLYRVPPTYDESEFWNLRSWEADYQACDTLQMHCTVLERTTMNQLSRLNSALNKSGLKIRNLIAASTKQPVYYYLYVQTGADLNSEVARKCPKCGDNWLLKKPWHDRFDFKCDKCHLLSNIALDLRESYAREN